MPLTLEFLGVGNFFAKKNHQNNLLINGNTLIDCGMTAGRSLSETGRTFADIDHIFITHTHADHIGGIEELAFCCKYLAGGKKPNLYLPEALRETLWEHSLRGGLEDTFNKASTLEDYFNVHLADPLFEIENIRFEIVPTFHVPEKFCCGLTINNHIFFSGDTQFDPDMIVRHGTHAEVIYHDCQFAPGGIHANLDELASLPESLRSKTWLMHYPDNAAQYEQKAESLGFQWTRQHTVYTFD